MTGRNVEEPLVQIHDYDAQVDILEWTNNLALNWV